MVFASIPAAPAGVEWPRWSTEMHLLVTDPSVMAEAKQIVDRELDAIELAASRFRPDSEVSMLAEAGGGRRDVSPVLSDLINAALWAAEFTGGDVDPTVGSALVALGYGDRCTEQAVPRITSVVLPVRWTDVEFDGGAITLPAGTLLDLGATAKAVAADRCARLVHERTGSGVLVNLGGDIATAGSAPDGGWAVMVRDTDADPASHITLGGDCGLATSSTQRRTWRRGGMTHHHILDPHTGQSVEPVWRTVSVGAGDCLTANAVSTAAIIRGRDAPGWVRGLELPARFVDRDGAERLMGGWPS